MTASAEEVVRTPDILSLIKSHHEILKESLLALKQENLPIEEKREELFIFLETLKMHAKSEQETLYACIEEVEPLRILALEAREEHEIADRLATEIEAMDYTENWSPDIAAKARVLAELVEHHLIEEEDEIFHQVRENFTHEELQALAVEYNERFKSRMERAGSMEGPLSHLIEVMSAKAKAAYHRAGDLWQKIA